jgi:hypothetical protein
MRYFLLLGGAMGFSLVFFASCYAGNRPALALRDAGVGCLVGAVLFRFLHGAFVAGMKSRILERTKQGEVLVSRDEAGDSRVR